MAKSPKVGRRMAAATVKEEGELKLAC